MVATRSMRKRSATKKRTYARRVRKSHCRGKGRATCRRASGCKYARGKKRSFCRKSKNAHCPKMKGGQGYVDMAVEGASTTKSTPASVE
jgi:hypothetical protein